jgi:hypothetical protein
MSTTLRSHLEDLASTFAESVLRAIRGASIEQLLGETERDTGRREGSKSATPTGRSSRAASPRGARPGKSRLARRSPAEIHASLSKIVTLLKSKKAGMRSEEIRKALQLDKRELPRVLKEGLAKKALKSKGQKRATTYAAG